MLASDARAFSSGAPPRSYATRTSTPALFEARGEIGQSVLGTAALEGRKMQWSSLDETLVPARRAIIAHLDQSVAYRAADPNYRVLSSGELDDGMGKSTDEEHVVDRELLLLGRNGALAGSAAACARSR